MPEIADIYRILIDEPFFLSIEQISRLTRAQIFGLYFRKRWEKPTETCPEPKTENDVRAWCEGAWGLPGNTNTREDHDAWVERMVKVFLAEKAKDGEEQQQGPGRDSDPI